MVQEVIDWSKFLACERGLLIAPAGHGKTTAIADCLNILPDDSCCLVLTHTHAGIASLKKKFKQKKVSPKKYQLETITGFAQRYVLAFLGNSVLPKPEDKVYFGEAVRKCTELLNSAVVQSILSLSFDGVIVDEYQDCTISQHNMIMALAQNMPLHILGDPLQGIFDFEHESLVDFNDDLSGLFGFKIFELLNYPWRWHGINIDLGIEILNYRKLLTKGTDSITLQNIPEKRIFLEQWKDPSDHYSSDYIKWLCGIIHRHESASTLILCPSYYEKNSKGIDVLRGDLTDRIRLKTQFDYTNSYLVLDAVDGKNYYTVAEAIDIYVNRCKYGSRINKVKHLFQVLSSLNVSKTFLNKWISKTKAGWDFKKKRKAAEDENQLNIIKKMFQEFTSDPALGSFLRLMECIRSVKGYSNHRPDFWGEMVSCIMQAESEGISLHTAMEKHRTRIRHLGRRIEGKCIGTTLLTKGLEFDTVILMNADKFQDQRHFYVAISRACRRLVFITDSVEMRFK